MTSFAADDGPRLLRGGPIATSIREQVAADVEAFKAESGYTPALAVVVVGKDAPVGGLPPQDPRRLPPGRDRGPPGRAARGRRRGRHRRRAARAPGRLPRGRDHHPDAAAAGHRAAGRDRRPGPAPRHRRDPPAQRRAPVAWATTGSSRRPPTPASRSSSRAASRSAASMPWSSAGPTSSASRRRSCSCARTPPSPSATARPQSLADVIRGADIVVVAIGRANFVTGDMLKAGCRRRGRRHQRRGRQARRATWSSRPPAASPRRSRPSPAASAR